MLREYTVPKPARVQGYPAHRIVMGLTNGKPAVFADAGDSLLIRTQVAIEAPSSEVHSYVEGDVLAFTLRASCSKKVKGKHRYFHKSDWRARHDWLDRKAASKGFEVLTVHSRSDIATIDNAQGRRFTIDQTDFTGVLKVTNPNEFQQALECGVGSNSKTFGFGFLILS